MPNPNPSPETRFGGPRANKGSPGGKSSAQKKAENAAAEKAALISDQMLTAIAEKLQAGEDPTDFIDAATLKLLKDVQDRAHGTPKQAVDHTSSDNSMTPPTTINLVGKE